MSAVVPPTVPADMTKGQGAMSVASETRVIRIPGPQGEEPDLLVTCQGFQFHVYAATLASRSDFFNRCLSSDFKEKQEGKIEINDKDPFVFQGFIYWAHQYDYPDYNEHPANSICQTDGPLVFNARMFALSIEYQVPDLTFHVVKKRETLIEKFGAGLPELVNAITITYTSTPACVRELRDIIAQYTAKKFMKPSGHQQLKGVLGDIPEIGSDVAMCLAEQVTKMKTKVSKMKADMKMKALVGDGKTPSSMKPDQGSRARFPRPK